MTNFTRQAIQLLEQIGFKSSSAQSICVPLLERADMPFQNKVTAGLVLSQVAQIHDMVGRWGLKEDVFIKESKEWLNDRPPLFFGKEEWHQNRVTQSISIAHAVKDFIVQSEAIAKAMDLCDQALLELKNNLSDQTLRQNIDLLCLFNDTIRQKTQSYLLVYNQLLNQMTLCSTASSIPENNS